MASAIYPKAKENMLSGAINIPSDTIKAVLVDTANYTYSTAHDFYDDVPAGARVGTPVALTNKSVTNGVFDADDTVFTSVTGATVEAIIIYKEGAGESSSPLIAYIEGTVTPNGGNVTVQWDSGASKIFAL